MAPPREEHSYECSNGSSIMDDDDGVGNGVHRPAAPNGSTRRPQDDPCGPTRTAMPPPKSYGSPRRNNGGGNTTHEFTVRLTPRFLLLTLGLSSIIAFGVGSVSRMVLLSSLLRTSGPGHHSRGIGGHRSKSDKSGEELALVVTPTMSGKRTAARQLPSPTVIEGKDVPFTTYASKTFQMAGASTSHTLHIDRTAAMLVGRRGDYDGGPDFQSSEGGKAIEGGNDDRGWVTNTADTTCPDQSCARGKAKQDKPRTAETDDDGEDELNDYSDHNDDSDGLHLPAGQHLLVDIKDVDSNFLNSEEALARAMIEICNESKLTLLSYHCHSLVPIGVSCAGVLLESHVAFHTWPGEGVITMDLFTCGGGLLVPLLPLIQEKFAVPSTETVKGGTNGDGDEVPPMPTMLWSHKLRGFREGFAPGYVRRDNPLDGSLGRYVLGKLDFDVKRVLYSGKTAVQNVNVYEVLEPRSRDVTSYYRSLEDDGNDDASYEARHRELFGPDKILFLDGIIQSTLYGDAPYHESIVHPAMLSHPHPRRVAIIGGGEGATLREVLKHRTVEEAVVLEIDRELVDICREHMPEWSDCADVGGSDAPSCFDDSRARLVFTDAFRWFVENAGFHGAGEKFDVIIMDSLAPGRSALVESGLYDETSFVGALHSSLTRDGVFAVQTGRAKSSSDPPEGVGRDVHTSRMMDALTSAGFGSLHTYDEGHSNFYMPWEYLVAMKDAASRNYWHRTEGQVEVELHRRVHRTRSSGGTDRALRYFDGRTIAGFTRPGRARETNYCLGRGEGEGGCVDAARGETESAYNPVRERRVGSRRDAVPGLAFA